MFLFTVTLYLDAETIYCSHLELTIWTFDLLSHSNWKKALFSRGDLSPSTEHVNFLQFNFFKGSVKQCLAWFSFYYYYYYSAALKVCKKENKNLLPHHIIVPVLCFSLSLFIVFVSEHSENTTNSSTIWKTTFAAAYFCTLWQSPQT